ncbi:MAG: hypothetical protein AAFQ82_13785, partial [Myxococcota bacterium]
IKRGLVLWPIGAAIAVLAHATGYLLGPVIAVVLLGTGPKHYFSKRLIPLYIALAALVFAIVVPNLETLPFFHEINCRNRTAGCQPSPSYYLGTLVVFLTSSHWAPTGSLDFGALAMALPLAALVAGLVTTLARSRSNPAEFVLLAALVVPLLLLSSRELKFPRYLFYCLPILVIFVARGAQWALERIRSRPAQRAGALLLVLTLIFLPVFGPEGLSSRWVDLIQRSLSAPKDNFERIRAQAEYVRNHASDQDIVVSSFDDASLAFYSGRFVHGFLNSRHEDSHFLGLLEEARRRDARVLFLDTLPTHNYCHTAHAPLMNIDCRDKYPYFYRACTAQNPDSRCVRVDFSQ